MTDAATSDAFRQAMQQRPDAVQLITYRTLDGSIEGMTATAVMALALTPPSVLLCVGHTSRARDHIRREKAFGISILATSQQALAARVGRSGGDKTLPGLITVEPSGELTPVLNDALATLQCRVMDDRDQFTHTIFAAEVLAARVGIQGEPLVHYLGGYRTVAP